MSDKTDIQLKRIADNVLYGLLSIFGILVIMLGLGVTGFGGVVILVVGAFILIVGVISWIVFNTKASKALAALDKKE